MTTKLYHFAVSLILMLTPILGRELEESMNHLSKSNICLLKSFFPEPTKTEEENEAEVSFRACRHYAATKLVTTGIQNCQFVTKT